MRRRRSTWDERGTRLQQGTEDILLPFLLSEREIDRFMTCRMSARLRIGIQSLRGAEHVREMRNGGHATEGGAASVRIYPSHKKSWPQTDRQAGLS